MTQDQSHGLSRHFRGDSSGASTAGGSRLSSTAPTWNSSFGSIDPPSPRPDDPHPHPQGSGDPGAFGVPAPGGYTPGTVVRPFIAYDAVEPFDTSLSLDKRRARWDKLQYTASSGGWRKQELCTRLYSRLSHEGLGATAPRVGPPELEAALGPGFKKFGTSTNSPVER
ncbi:LOW QUALITY PROTEIN: hypothetical protein PHMEG_00022839 [Phytophthora megakarya]|uniref:Uncharacterized protein n=1 Tax=Phytophthora megakarya TaxID=4795 RepID=A0A225VK31_9STRA|nr:LOW QUALITY PROTEIN: hypothetical protein PHMEG_00022839 [Phytophthora megakarya]